MKAKLLASHADARCFHADWRDLVEVVAGEGGCDLLLVDAPYSLRTHRGHDEGAVVSERARDHAARNPTGASKRPGVASPAEERARANYERKGRCNRRKISYAHWAPAEVKAFVRAWEPLTRGWFVALTDHVLARVWASALGQRGRYVFSPVACVEPGRAVRMAGDGPAQWTCWAVLARPRGETFSKWGARDGAYVVPRGLGERAAKKAGRVIGGKPLWLMQRLVEDYSRRGGLVCDPCAGGGTTLRAAQLAGRRSLGGDVDPKTAALAAQKISAWAQTPLPLVAWAGEASP